MSIEFTVDTDQNVLQDMLDARDERYQQKYPEAAETVEPDRFRWKRDCYTGKPTTTEQQA